MELVLTNLLLIALGGCLGSFASVLIYRLPLENSEINILQPRSFCPLCKNQLTIMQLIPFVGYLYTKGTCRTCNAKISPAYFIHEVLITAFIILIFYKMEFAALLSWLTVLIVICLYIQSIIDIQTLHLFQPLSIILVMTGLFLNILSLIHI